VSRSENGNAYFREIDCGARAADYQTTVQRKAHGFAGEQYMATNRQENNQNERRSPGFGVAGFLFIVVLTVLLFVLVNSMVRHHFFSGGQQNQHDVNRP
jgi:hypothetical protein